MTMYPVGNANSNNVDTPALDVSHFFLQLVNFTGRFTVSDKNSHILNVWTISVSSVEYLCPH